ncbi:MAG: hypothetical protein HWQ40_17330 [Nostoc sp. NMS9]|nr:hypothetical protein [Nostoc sp. NMS9]
MSRIGYADANSVTLKLKRFSSKAFKSVCYNWTTTQLSCRALYEKSRRWSFWWR